MEIEKTEALKKKELELNEERKRLDLLKAHIDLERERIQLNHEKSILGKELGQIEFKKKHPILTGFSQKWENGMKRIFKGIGSSFSKVGKGLAASDKWLAEQELKEKKIKL